MSDPLDLVFLCAGRGTRVGLDVPKQFLKLRDKPVMLHSLEVYASDPRVGRKIIVHDPVDVDRIQEVLSLAGISDALLVPGGATRQESVRAGIAAVTSKRVLTHNAAVPFVTHELIEQVIETEADCVSTATELKDSLVRVQQDGLLPLSRNGLRIVNSPQSFRTEALRLTHESARRDGRQFNSDAELMYFYGRSLRLVPGPAWTFKITDRVDLALAETILNHPELFPALCPQPR